MNKTLRILSAFVLCSFGAAAQQDIALTHFIYNKFAVNPGATGIEEGLCGNLIYRNQWDKVNGNEDDNAVGEGVGLAGGNGTFLSAMGQGNAIAHASWAIPRRILLTHDHAVVGVRRDARGWQVLSRARGWQPVRLCRDSVAVPGLVVLRFVRAGGWLGESQYIPPDALGADEHRRVRVRLNYSRRRWGQASQV